MKKLFALILLFLCGCSDNKKYIEVELIYSSIVCKEVLAETADYYVVEFHDYKHKIYKDPTKITAPLFGAFHYEEARFWPKEGKQRSIYDNWMSTAKRKNVVINELWNNKKDGTKLEKEKSPKYLYYKKCKKTIYSPKGIYCRYCGTKHN